jgi:hypothetical protein
VPLPGKAMFMHHASLFTKLGLLHITTLMTASLYAIRKIAPVALRFLFTIGDNIVAFQGVGRMVWHQ